MAGGKNLATKYANKADERFSKESQAMLAVNSDFEFTGANTVKVYSIPVVAMSDYQRNGSNRYGTPSDLTRNVQSLTVTKDRAFSFIIDKGDKVQSEMVSDAGKALARQIREVWVPEFDTYVFRVLADAATESGNTDATTATTSNAYSLFLNAMEKLGNQNVPDKGRVCFCSCKFANLLKQDSAFMRYGDAAQQMLIRGVIGEVDGCKIVKVPSGRLPSGCSFILTHPMAATAPRQLEEYKTHDNPPGISGWLVEGRVIYDCFVLGEKRSAIFYQGGAGGLKQLTVGTADERRQEHGARHSGAARRERREVVLLHGRKRGGAGERDLWHGHHDRKVDGDGGGQRGDYSGERQYGHPRDRGRQGQQADRDGRCGAECGLREDEMWGGHCPPHNPSGAARQLPLHKGAFGRENRGGGDELNMEGGNWMTYGQMRDRVLMLLNQYSIAGGKIRVTYNNQADYLARVPGAVNEALVYLATTARRLRSVRKLEEAERAGVWRVFVLPEDCWQICSGGVFRLGADGSVERTNGFRLLGEDRLAVAGAADGAWMLEYFRYPVLLREKPEDGDLVDCPPECAGAVACYAAAQLAALDDANLQAALYNEFENRLSRLGELPVANREEIGNMYGGWEAVE